MTKSFDVVVIGAGPGGYVAAIRSAQLGLKVCCVDDFKDHNGNSSLGGTCLNVGCIPSKAMLESSENYEKVAHKFDEHGINVRGITVDIPTMLERKDKIVSQFTGGIGILFKKNKVTSIHGRGRFVAKTSSGYEIEVVNGEVQETIHGVNVIVATGSLPRPLPGLEVDNELVCDNVGALSFSKVPKRLGVIGAGVIGLEMGSVWKRLGSDVTILEALPEFLNLVDRSVAKEAKRAFTQSLGLKIFTGVNIKDVRVRKKSVEVLYEDSESEQTIVFDKLVVSIGRIPNSANIGAENVGLIIDEKGVIPVDEKNCTNLNGVYAIGDVVRGPMLAHKSSEEGVAVAETISGQHGHVNLDTIPWVIYTSPEIAWVGRTEQDLKESGVSYKIGQFPFSVSGRARAIGETGGFVKMIADATSDKILGVHIIGPYASELITEAVVAMEFEATAEDIARIVHAHPSLSEAMHEAALGVDGRYLSL